MPSFARYGLRSRSKSTSHNLSRGEPVAAGCAELRQADCPTDLLPVGSRRSVASRRLRCGFADRSQFRPSGRNMFRLRGHLESGCQISNAGEPPDGAPRPFRFQADIRGEVLWGTAPMAEDTLRPGRPAHHSTCSLHSFALKLLPQRGKSRCADWRFCSRRYAGERSLSSLMKRGTFYLPDLRHS